MHQEKPNTDERNQQNRQTLGLKSYLRAKKNPAGPGFKAQIDATTIWAGVHARDGDGLR